MRSVVFLVKRLVANDRPARGFDHLDVEAMLGVEAHRLRHDDRRAAGNGDEADLEVLLFDGPTAREDLARGLQRKELRQRSERSRGAKRLQKCTAPDVLREKRTHHRRSDHILVTFLVTFDRETSQLRGVPFMVGLADMTAARTSAALQRT